MEQKRIDKIYEAVVFTGFSDFKMDDLMKIINSGEKEILWPYQKEFKETGSIGEANLHFKRSEKEDNIFFNGFDLAVTMGEYQEKTYFSKGFGNSITLLEGHQLLLGNSIYKEFAVNKNKELGIENKNEPDNDNKKEFKPAGVYLNFENRDLKTGNPEQVRVFNFYPYKEIMKYDIPALQFTSTRNEIMDSISKGFAKEVEININGKPEKTFLKLNARRKWFDGYKEKRDAYRLGAKTMFLPRITASQGQKESKGEGQETDPTKGKNKGNDTTITGGTTKKNNKGVGIS